jgi:hypothetical protein
LPPRATQLHQRHSAVCSGLSDKVAALGTEAEARAYIATLVSTCSGTDGRARGDVESIRSPPPPPPPPHVHCTHMMQTMTTAEAQAEAMSRSVATVAARERTAALDREAGELREGVELLRAERSRAMEAAVTQAVRCDQAAEYYGTVHRVLATAVGL